MLVHIGICSVIGGLSVSCTQGLGASILTSIRGNNQVSRFLPLAYARRLTLELQRSHFGSSGFFSSSSVSHIASCCYKHRTADAALR